MKRVFYVTAFMSVFVAGCVGEKEAPSEEASLTEYKALGTEPGWTAEFKDGQITHTSMAGDNDFTVPLSKVRKNQTGWVVYGYTNDDNIRLMITSGEKCSDGMSDREYADTVEVAVSSVGTVQGCGGEIISGGDVAP